LQITLGWGAHQSAAAAGWIGLVEDERLRVMATEGYGEQAVLTTESFFPLEHPAIDAVLSTARPMRRMVGPQCTRFLPNAAVQTVVPVLRDERMIGVLFLEHIDDELCVDETIAFLQRLCDHAALAIANAQLHAAVHAANLAKSEFVSLVAHELRTPMAAIKGFTDLMERGGFGTITEQQGEWIQLIRSSLETMTALVSDLADVSRIEAGQMRLMCDPVSLPNVVAEAASSIQAQCEARGQTLTVAASLDLPPVWADRMRLNQVLMNLLSNAHKYTPPGGRITVAVELARSADVMQVTVQDTGFGLSVDDQQHIFQKFFRSAQPSVRDQPGTGLGLSITKHLVELQGGQIWFESAYGQGTAFHFTVPLAPTAALIDAL
jgi:signal transduction histidine kinase